MPKLREEKQPKQEYKALPATVTQAELDASKRRLEKVMFDTKAEIANRYNQYLNENLRSTRKRRRGWTTPGSPERDMSNVDRQTAIAKVRQKIEESPVVKGMIQSLADSIVGADWRLSMRTEDEGFNKETETHPVLVSGIAQFQLVHIHPFLDGNGRTSRLLSTLCLYRTGYDFKRLFTISEYYDRDRATFYQAIQGVRESNMDMTGWIEYFIEGLSTQLAEVRDRGEQAIRRDVLTRKHKLSDRQGKALGHILEHGRLTIQDYERLCPEVNRRTLQRDLKAMIDKGLVFEKASSPTDPTKHYLIVESHLK